MSVFTSPIRHRPWLMQITLLSAVFGALLGLSLKTQDRIRRENLPDMRISKIAKSYMDLRETNLDLTKKIADLQKRLSDYQKAAADENGNAKLLSADLQKANLLAGLVAVSGSGVVVTLKDSKNLPPKPSDMSQEAYVELCRPYLIHDQDIAAVINELRAAGAEAIAVNDQRVVATTAVRCVGPTVMVNNTPTNGSPVKIKAIGEPDTLQSSLMMPGGVSDQYKITDPSMITVDKVKNQTLPAYAGAMPLRYAQPAPEKSAEQAQKAAEDAAKGAPAPNDTNKEGTRKR
jgi:uncharacterized protein YlxW (UPF0749 family)